MTTLSVEDLASAAGCGDALLAHAIAGIESGARLEELQKATRLVAQRLGAHDCDVEVRLIGDVNGVVSGNPCRPVALGDVVHVAVRGSCSGAGFRGARMAVAARVSDSWRPVLEHAAEATAWVASRLLPGRPRGLNITWSRGATIMPRVFSLGTGSTATPCDLHGSQRFEVDMVLVAAPILNVPGFGELSLEQTVAITPRGPLVLSQSPLRTWLTHDH